MTTSDYVNLHTHTVHSLLDGFSRIPDLVDRVKELGQDALAVTDHGSMAGVPTLWREAKRAGIKPIAGIEAYFCEDINVKEKIEGRRVPYYHITLIAKDRTGYENLCRLNREAYTKGFYSKPRVDPDLLARHSSGVVCLAGCVGGWPQQLILGGHMGRAVDAVSVLYSIYGDDFYLEIQDTGEADQKPVNKAFLEFSRSLGIPVALTADSHYTRKEDHDLHDSLLCIGLKKQKASDDRLKFVPGRYHVGDASVLRRLGYPETCLSITRDIADKCGAYDLPIAGGLPRISADSLEELAIRGLESRMPGAPQPYWDRLLGELSVIYSCGFDSYFSVIHKIISYANEREMFHGWGRGSSAGSLVAYCLGITAIDPIKYGLHFERFLNSERREPPDVDLDFTDEHRPTIIEYIEETFGKEHVCQVGTYGTLGPKQVLIDACKVFGKDENVARAAVSMLPRDPLLKISHVLENSSLMGTLRRVLGDDVLGCMEAFNEVPRHASAHAAGVIIDSNNLSEALPVMSQKSDSDKEVGHRTRTVTQYAYSDLEELGYVKIDVLGVKMLRVMEEVARKLRIDLFNVPLDDSKTYELLSGGKTAGVFQFEHYGSQLFLRDFRPKDFNDVMLANALYRPGPMQGEQGLGEIVARRCGRKRVTYAHPSLETVLKPTYGLMIYQEQVMEVVRILAGWTLNEADQLRWAIGKKKKEKVVELKDKFIRDCVKKRLPSDFAEERFKEIEFFGRYGWNKSHAAAYGMVTYVSAWLKANHTAHYMCSLLNADHGDHDRTNDLIRECARLGLRVKRPHVNHSDVGFDVWGGGNIDRFLVMGLAAVKYLGERAAKEIVSERKRGNIYSSIEDFRGRLPRKIVNSNQFSKLAAAKAFSDMSETDLEVKVPF